MLNRRIEADEQRGGFWFDDRFADVVSGEGADCIERRPAREYEERDIVWPVLPEQRGACKTVYPSQYRQHLSFEEFDVRVRVRPRSASPALRQQRYEPPFKPANLPRPRILVLAKLPYCFIILRMSAYCFMTCFTSCPDLPLPAAMRLR